MAITVKRSASTFHKSNPRPTDAPVGAYGAKLMATQNASQASALVGPSGFKNLLVNGDFRVWQRGTQGSANTTSGCDSADRWWINKSSGTGYSERYVFTRGDSLIPGNPSYAIKVVCDTGNNNFGLLQKVEDVRAFMGKHVTLSFWAKGRNPGGGHFKSSWIRSYTSAGNNGEWTVADNIVLNEEWQFFSFTTKVPNLSAAETIDDTESYLWVDILRQPGDDTSTSNWDYKLANVQLELGTQPTEFEYRPMGVELPLCQRYYYRETISNNDFYSGMGMADIDGNTVILNLPFPVTMRAIPDIDINGMAATNYMIRRSTTKQCTSLPSLGGATTQYQAAVQFISSSHGFSDGSAVRCGAWGTSWLGFDSEL